MIEQLHTKYIIVGAGLSGLTTAYELLQNGINDFIILEGRKRIGGRINTNNNIDLGAAWFQNYHSNVSQLIAKLGINIFDQYSTGKGILVYREMVPPHYFEGDPNTPASHRITGGSFSIIDELAKRLQDKIILNTPITEVIEDKNHINLKTTKGTYSSEKAILTIPPRLAANLNFNPTLNKGLTDAMKETHTWMSNAIKVGITYSRPFWRDRNLSGTVINQTGPVTELYDHSNHAGTDFGLMGFINESQRANSAEGRKEIILAYLEKYLGDEVRNYLNYQEKDWSQDKFTTRALTPLYSMPQYGHPLFQDSYMDGKLYFSGAETSTVYGGYMEGAVYSGLNMANVLLK
jgi:monoamine oxidase